jgi:hypothetical protein
MNELYELAKPFVEIPCYSIFAIGIATCIYDLVFKTHKKKG